MPDTAGLDMFVMTKPSRGKITLCPENSHVQMPIFRPIKLCFRDRVILSVFPWEMQNL